MQERPEGAVGPEGPNVPVPDQEGVEEEVEGTEEENEDEDENEGESEG